MKWPLFVLAGLAIGCGDAPSRSDVLPDARTAEELACRAKHWLMTRVDEGWACLPYASSIEECAERGGEVVTIDGKYWACYQETSDAGRSCRDGQECFGYCEPPEDATEGEEVTGVCSRRTYEECFRQVEDGRVTSWLCL